MIGEHSFYFIFTSGGKKGGDSCKKKKKKRGECILGPIIMFSLHVGRPLKQELRGSIEEGESELICHLHRWRDHCADKNEKIAEWTATQQSTRKSRLR